MSDETKPFVMCNSNQVVSVKLALAKNTSLEKLLKLRYFVLFSELLCIS